MAETHKIRMAAATKSDIADLYTLKHVLEFIKEKEVITSIRDFDELELTPQERNFLSQIFEDEGIEVNNLVHYLVGLIHGFGRVVMGFEVLYDNCADPSLDYLDFNKSIKESTVVWNHLAEHLKEGREVCIKPDSTLGQMILLSEQESDKEKEVSNG